VAARRCVLHGSYPDQFRFHRCPVCSEPTYYASNDEPDEYWEQNIARHLERAVQGETVPPDVPVLEGAKVTLEDKQYFISTWDVVNGGIRHRLSLTDLVQVGKQVFEILEYRYSERRYLVQPFSTSLTDEQVSDLAGP
jgi:hypothetical protein